MYHEENGVYLRMPEIHPTMIIDNTNKRRLYFYEKY